MKNRFIGFYGIRCNKLFPFLCKSFHTVMFFLAFNIPLNRLNA
jgi:hypothetical protein